MRKICRILLIVLSWMQAFAVYATEKFEILPDLPEPLAAAQASSVSTAAKDSVSLGTAASIQEPNLISVFFTLVFVILLIYATGIIYARINKASISSLKKQIGDANSSKATVISTTPLGSNKTLHVVELDGKRMLIGASVNSIQLLKDLGSCSSVEINEGEYSKIEIPNIRIPKIEIPKIEFPNIGFTKAFAKTSEDENQNTNSDDSVTEDLGNENNDNFEISDIYEEGSDGIIDKLFHTSPLETESAETIKQNEHKVDADEYALYKKYL